MLEGELPFLDTVAGRRAGESANPCGAAGRRARARSGAPGTAAGRPAPLGYARPAQRAMRMPVVRSGLARAAPSPRVPRACPP